MPAGAAGANEAGIWLLGAWNEAMAAIPNWPTKQPAASADAPPIQTLYGRRRLDWFSRHANGFAQELRKNPLVSGMSGKRFSCTSNSGATEALELRRTGDARLGSRSGRWGAMNDPTIGEALCPVDYCLFVDLFGQTMNANAATGGKLTLYRNHYGVQSAAERARPQWSCERV